MNHAAWERMRRRYLQRSALVGEWRVEGIDPCACNTFDTAIIIPALAEGEELFVTLDSIARNPACGLNKILILVVVNQRCNAPAEIKRQNRADLERLPRYARATPHLNLAWVDAADPSTALPSKRGGVGMARKIGADLLLPHIAPYTVLTHLDADTRVQSNYASTLVEYAQRETFYAGVIAFAHAPCADLIQQLAIEDYELYLRCHVAALQWAGSPYAYHSIGSTMASSAYAYVNCGGMNLRQAGEDFYFLQQLAKTGGVEHIAKTCVFPAPRISTRTPFGTGQHMHQAHNSQEPLQLFYPLRCYAVLRSWLKMVSASPESNSDALLAQLQRESPAGAQFLRAAGFGRVWTQLQTNHNDVCRRIKAFHEWFDALKSWQLIRTLGAEVGAPYSAREVIGDFLPLLDESQIPHRYRSLDEIE
ncbi:MAG: glycosyltransferase family A protein [Desulfuromonadaceae bacterium]